jgi:hypothetical protein
MTNFGPVHTIITTSLTVAADLAAGCIRFTRDAIKTGCLKQGMSHARGGASNGSLLTQISAPIQRQLGYGLLGGAVPAGELFFSKSLQSKEGHHSEEYLTDSLQSHISS